MHLNKYPKFAGLVLLTVVLAVLVIVQAQREHSAEHSQHNAGHDVQQNEDATFAEREQEVMPFNLEATLHVFQDTATGGVQRVIANDPNNTENTALIRSHLKEEAARFARGDFADPSYLHGEEMPGLSELEQAGEANQLTVSYSDIENGGEIVYSSEEADVIIALHLWFQAQVTDHGDHATN